MSSLALLEADSPLQSWPDSGAVDVVVVSSGRAASASRAVVRSIEFGIRGRFVALSGEGLSQVRKRLSLGFVLKSDRVCVPSAT